MVERYPPLRMMVTPGLTVDISKTACPHPVRAVSPAGRNGLAAYPPDVVREAQVKTRRVSPSGADCVGR